MRRHLALVPPTSSETSHLDLSFPVQRYTLSNGLTVLLHPDATVPTISYNTWFRVGSRYEKPGTTGIAHLFEHMMFKGAKRYTNKEYDRVLQANGGTNNAFTTHDYTGFYVMVPSTKLELAIDMESDRMENLQITPENLKSEREVVKEERRWRVDNQVLGVMDEVKFGSLFKVHPYRWPVIGYMTDIDNITIEDCRKFFDTYYSPSNAVVVIAGQFDPEVAKKLIEKYYGKIVTHPVPTPATVTEPDQLAERKVVLKKDVQSDYLNLSWVVPGAGAREAYALDLLAAVIGEGTASRLQRRLVHDLQLASDLHVSNDSMKDYGVFNIDVRMGTKKPYRKALPVIEGVLSHILNEPLTADEVTRARNTVLKNYIDGMKTVHGRAQSLEINEVVLGDYRRVFTDVEIYQQITADEIQKAAKKYLTKVRRNTISAEPGAAK